MSAAPDAATYHNPSILTAYMLPGVSLVIPCVPAHVRYLAECLRSARAQTCPPQEVVVALSACAPDDNNTTIAAAEAAAASVRDARMPVRILAQREPASAADNRNRGARASTQPIVSFMDADDTMHPRRLERVTVLLREHRADAVLHGYAHKRACDTWPVGSGRVVSPEEARVLEAGDRSCVHLTFLPITHGHISVRRDVIDATPQNPRAHMSEDSLFVRNVFAAGFRVVLTTDELSSYWQDRSAGSGGGG